MILLVQPFGNKWDYVTKRVPNGLLSVAAPLVRDGYEVVIIDQKIHYDWKRKIANYLDRGLTCVGLTCFTGEMIQHALEVSRFVKEAAPDVPLVWGGPHPSLLPEQTLSCSDCIDIVVINEGDITFHELVRKLEEKGDINSVKGIFYKDKKNGNIKSTPHREVMRDLDELASLPYHLVEMENYSSIQTTTKKTRSIDLMSSRGCPFSCAFCSVPVMPGRLWRTKSVKRMVEEIKFLKKTYGIEEFYYVDDNFMVNLKRVEDFVDALLRENLDILWGLQGVRLESIGNASVALLDKLEKAGCTELSIGVESGNQRILNIIDKKIKMKDVHEINDKLKGRAFQIKYNFIIGFPTENIEEVKKSVDLAVTLAKVNKKAYFPFNIFTPFPGTKIFPFAVKNGFQPPAALDGWIEIEASGKKSPFRKYIDPQLYDFLININVISYLAFPIAKTKINNRLFRFLFILYCPIAYYRFSRHNYKLFFEKHLMKLLIN